MLTFDGTIESLQEAVQVDDQMAEIVRHMIRSFPFSTNIDLDDLSSLYAILFFLDDDVIQGVRHVGRCDTSHPHFNHVLLIGIK